MPFTPEQTAELKAPLQRANTRKNPRGFDYVESWHAEAEANRIFGFDGWSSVILETKCVMEKERKLSSGDGWSVTYIATVRVTAGGQARDGAGAGHGMDKDLGLAHESAIKEATSDAEKRALKTFGNPFGLALYDKTQENVEGAPAAPQSRAAAPARQTYAKPVDTPLEAFIAAMKMNKTVAAVEAWGTREAGRIAEKLRRPDQDKLQAAYDEWLNECAARLETAA